MPLAPYSLLQELGSKERVLVIGLHYPGLGMELHHLLELSEPDSQSTVDISSVGLARLSSGLVQQLYLCRWNSAFGVGHCTTLRLADCRWVSTEGVSVSVKSTRGLTREQGLC